MIRSLGLVVPIQPVQCRNIYNGQCLISVAVHCDEMNTILSVLILNLLAIR